jgi:hypothetical protein
VPTASAGLDGPELIAAKKNIAMEYLDQFETDLKAEDIREHVYHWFIER